MDDAIAATIKIMQAPVEEIKIRSSYNLAAMSLHLLRLLPKSRNTFLNLPLRMSRTSQKITAGLQVLMIPS
jgi:hypothetical protein